MAMPAPPTWPRTPYHPRGCHSFRVAVRGRAPPWAASPRRADPHAPRARPVGRAPARSAPAQHRSVDPTAVPHRMQWAMREPLDAAFVPTGHLASRVSGIPDDADDARREMAWRGVSNYHRDPKDAWRRFSPSPTKSIPSPTLPYHPLPPPTYDRFGVPIIYVPRISPRARRDRKYVKSHALPSSDLILCEGKDGGRAVRIVTCTDGWVCIVNTHYEVCMHSGSFPVGPEGVVGCRAFFPINQGAFSL
jgi:hypothetical protein